jgi:hypothetical protein
MSLRVSTFLAVGAAALVASCSTAPAQEARDPKAQRHLDEELAGRTAGPPVRCLPQYRANDMQIIDDNTILFKDGRTIYVQHPHGGCPGIAFGNYTLVTRLYGTAQLCDGDIQRLVDFRTGMGGGSCVFSPFIPYKKG